MKAGPTPDGPWSGNSLVIASGTLPDPIPFAENETQVPLDITQLSSVVQTQVCDLHRDTNLHNKIHFF